MPTISSLLTLQQRAMVSLLGGTVGIYVYCLLKLDVDEPFTDEINRKAERLLDDANRANSKSSDFDS